MASVRKPQRRSSFGGIIVSSYSKGEKTGPAANAHANVSGSANEDMALDGTGPAANAHANVSGSANEDMALDGGPRQRREPHSDCEVTSHRLAQRVKSLQTQVRFRTSCMQETNDRGSQSQSVACCKVFWFPPQAVQEPIGSMVGSVKHAPANRESQQLSARAGMQDALTELQVGIRASQCPRAPGARAFS
jgi:hypothetical protein